MTSTTAKDTLQFLETLGLSDIEIKIYLTLLEKGGQSVQELARIIGMNRTTLYSYINSLLEKGLLVRMVKGERTLFAVNEIEKSLTSLVEDKLSAVRKVQEELPVMLQAIEGLSAPITEDSSNFEIKYYKGKHGVQKIYEDALQSKELKTFVNLSEMTLPEIDELFKDIFEKNPGIKIYEIISDSPAAREKPKMHPTRYFRKFMPNSVGLAFADTLIYDGKVSIVNVKGNISGTVLNNKDHFTNSNNLFDYIWNTLPEESI